jgi:hypothetical protein
VAPVIERMPIGKAIVGQTIPGASNYVRVVLFYVMYCLVPWWTFLGTIMDRGLVFPKQNLFISVHLAG